MFVPPTTALHIKGRAYEHISSLESQLCSIVSLVLKYTTPFTMVKLNVVHTSNTALVQSQPLVAVFFGGTSGIGHYTLRALATAEANGGKGFRAYIVGRKAKAAEDIISECRGIYPQGQFKFVKADDLSLIQDVDRVCADIIQLEEKEGQDPRIDYLMMSQGGSIFLPRKGMFKVSDVVALLTITQIQKKELTLQCP
jgi:hypothetical protein